MEALLSKDPSFYGDVLGDDIMGEISTDGELDPETLLEILDTLPLDMKSLLLEKMGL